MRFWKSKPVSGTPTVTMIVASYVNGDKRRSHALRCLVCSLWAQTYKHWSATIVHDGSLTEPLYLPEELRGTRVRLVQTPQRVQQFGHPHRRKYALEADAEFIGFTNDDNYYMPTYFEWMLAELQAKKADFAYCNMIHSHQGWQPFDTKPKYRGLDMGGFIVRKKLVEAVPWTDFSFKGDGTYINALVAAAAGRVVKVPATLFVHN